MTERIIDLRSDTVTLPSDPMREAIAQAPVGDDVYGEDPSVRLLEQMSAERTGQEAALFVASGTMSNLVAIMAHCERGDEAIVGGDAHILQYEVAGAAGVAGVQLRAVPNDPRGLMDPGEVEAMVRGANVHMPRTALLCLENTHNRCSGAAIPIEHMEELAGIARQHGARIHIDGARIFNAALALGTTVSRLAAPADSIGFCLSKGLGAPVGSVLCGSADFIGSARRARKMLGGGMRQAGVIAAAGIWALENMVDRLAEDHENARALARGLAELPMVDLDPTSIDTNIVIFGVRGDWAGFMRSLKAAGVLAGSPKPGRLRMVTHYGIERADIDEALERARHAASVARVSVVRAGLALLLLALVATACGSEGAGKVRDPIVTNIPWDTPEAYRYQLNDNDGERQGSVILSARTEGDQLVLAQISSDDDGNSDTSVLTVDPETLEPHRGHREIIDDSDDRRVVLDTEYGELNEGSYGVRIRQRTFSPSDEEDASNERCNPRRVPENSYDNESSLFLWRTIKFEEGYAVTYNAVIANRRTVRPVTLRVRRQERVRTPGGEFDSWLIGIEAEGQAHQAWFATTDDHKLLVYSNDDQVFLYEGEAEDVPESPLPEGVAPDCN